MDASTSQLVAHVSELAQLELSAAELPEFATAFAETLDHIENLQELDVSAVSDYFQVTDLNTVTREDVIDLTRTFSQEEALSQAQATHQGFFVVQRLIDKE